MNRAIAIRMREAGFIQAGGSLRGEEPERYALAGLKERFSKPFM
jgi:hypothetical protein